MSEREGPRSFEELKPVEITYFTPARFARMTKWKARSGGQEGQWIFRHEDLDNNDDERYILEVFPSAKHVSISINYSDRLLAHVLNDIRTFSTGRADAGKDTETEIFIFRGLRGNYLEIGNDGRFRTPDQIYIPLKK